MTVILSDDAQRHYLQPSSKGLFKADVYITRLTTGEEVVCKDYSRFAGKLLAGAMAKWMVRHEFSILQQLNDWPNSPSVYAVDSPFMLVQERVRGHELGSQDVHEPRLLWQTLFLTLIQLHQQGIAHNDIRHTNIIVRDDGKPILIDFTTACRLPNVWLLRRIMLWMRLFDLRHLLKAKRTLKQPYTRHQQQLASRAKWEDTIMHFWKEHLLKPLKARKRRREGYDQQQP